MTDFVKACPLTIYSAQAGGDGSFGSAVSIEIPSPHTIALIELTTDAQQGIKFPAGNVGDRVEVYTVSRPTMASNASKLRIWDADGNNLLQTDVSGAMPLNSLGIFTKILPSPYSVSGQVSGLVGTWLGQVGTVTPNYPST
jgi:hypothetical protein